MVAVVIIALCCAALGAIAWALSKYRAMFGAMLPVGSAVTVALILWMITTAVGLSHDPATAWIPWILSIAAGGATAWLIAELIGRTRHNEGVARETQILQIR